MHIFSTGFLQPSVPAGSSETGLFILKKKDTGILLLIFFYKRDGRVCGSVIHTDYFQVLYALVQYTVQGCVNVFLCIVDRNDYT